MKWSPGRVLPPLPLIVPSLLSGVLITLCFPLTSLGPVSFLALAPVFVASLRAKPSPREAYKAGYLMGFMCFATMLWWILMLSPAADATIPVLSHFIPKRMTMPLLLTPALALLALYLGLYVAVFFLCISWLTRWRMAAFVIAAPALWSLLEIVRSRGELAFPWGVLGYTLSYHPPLLQSAEFWGVYGLSFIIVLVNALIAALVTARGPRARALSGGLACAIAAGLFLYGNGAVERADALEGEPMRVGIAQPNVDLAIKWDPAFKDSSFNQIDRQSAEAKDGGAQFVVFPETCAPVYIDRAQGYRERLTGTAQYLGIPIYLGFLDFRYDGPHDDLNVYNSSGVLQPDGSIDKYDKRHLLPFGEQLPWSSRFRALRKVDFGQANFQPGAERPPLVAGDAAFTPLICFELVFPYLCRQGVEQGSELFVNITNDGWFGDTPGPFQHAQMCIARAVEFRRWLVRSANSGISMVVTPAGEVQQSLGLDQTGILLADVRLLEVRTVYERLADTPLIVVSLLMAVLSAIVARRRTARRR